MRVIFVIVLSLCCFTAIAQKAIAATTDTLMDVYEGKLDCGGCTGWKMTLTLIHERYAGMGSFVLRHEYVGQDSPYGGRDSFEVSGLWSHHRGMYGDRNAVVVCLFLEESILTAGNYLQLKNGDMLMLDKQFKRITEPGNYILKKKSSAVISNGTKHSVVK